MHPTLIYEPACLGPYPKTLVVGGIQAMHDFWGSQQWLLFDVIPKAQWQKNMTNTEKKLESWKVRDS